MQLITSVFSLIVAYVHIMVDVRTSRMPAILAVFCVLLPCALSVIAELQGELVAWRNPRIALIQRIIVMESPGIVNQSGRPLDLPYLPVFGMNLTRCYIGLDDPWSKIQYYIPETAAQENPTSTSVTGGALLHDDFSYYAFGGMSAVPSTDNVTGMSYCSVFTNPKFEPTAWEGGYTSSYSRSNSALSLSNRCCGADVSVPGLSRAFYFGGLVSENRGPLTDPFRGPNQTVSLPMTVSSTLVGCDLSSPGSIECHTLEVSENVGPRAESGLLWIPYGTQGSLVLIGGTTQPADLNIDTTRTSNLSDSGFTTNIPIYDISADVWYTQATTGDPMPTSIAAFCSVVAGTSDGTGHHIYIYGGYDSAAETGSTSDQVWILALPSFRWILAAEGSPRHRRQNHRCVLASGTQMISIGGTIEGGKALEVGIIDVFDLNSLTWTQNFDRSRGGNYMVPDSVITVVGGTQEGANRLPDNLAPDVAALLSVPYTGPTGASYSNIDCTDGNSGTPVGSSNSAARWLNLPRWMSATIALSFCLMISLWALLALVTARRRTYVQAANINAAAVDSSNRLVRWMHNMPAVSENMKERRPTRRAMVLPVERDSSTPLKLAYVDEEEVTLQSTSVRKTTGSSIRGYERSFLEGNGEVELRTFMKSDHLHTS